MAAIHVLAMPNAVARKARPRERIGRRHVGVERRANMAV
jgi:hypothetical protein